MQQRFLAILFFLVMLPAYARDLPLNLIKLPPGFKIELYARNVPNARSMNLSPGGTLFVGSREAGKVYAIRDSNQDGRGDKVYVIARGLNMPNGVAFHKGALYVAEISRILRFDDIENRLVNPPPPVVISTDFPTEQHHGWKFIRIGPDEKLYVPIGAPCNVCIEYGYAVITRLNLDGSEHEIYAEGVRNSVGFDWHPDTSELWFTDNGRDQLGDDVPADELNRAPDERMHFGFPYCHGGELLDPEFGLGHRCTEYVPPVQKLGAHVASLGMRFYVGEMFPARYRKQVFIAEHGSWNRTEKSGYRISLVGLKGDRAVSYEAFAEGWLQGQEAWGRPVDIEHMPDGSLLVSDDKAGVIYRIYFDGNSAAATPVVPGAKQHPGQSTDEKPGLPPVKDNTIQEQVHIRQQAPIMDSTESIDTNPPNQADALPPQATDEQVLDQKSSEPEVNRIESRQQPQSGLAPQQQAKPQPAPPADVVEKIRARTEQDAGPTADPFSPVKKQTVNQ